MLASHKFCHNADHANLVVSFYSLFPPAALITHLKYEVPGVTNAFSAHTASSTVGPAQDYVFSTKQQYIQAITTHPLVCIQRGTWNRFQIPSCQVIILKTLSKPWQKCFCCIPRKYPTFFLENKIFKCIWKFPAFLWFYNCPDYAFTQVNCLITNFFLKLKADLISKFPFSY